MKLKLSIIIIAACLIAGCNSENTIGKGTPDENGMVYMEFSSGVPIVENNSRTQLGEDGLSVNWSDGDAVAVFSDSEPYEFTEISVNGNSAVFGGMITEGVGETFALYPYNATAVDSTVKNKVEFINTYIPAFQTIPAGGYDPKACVSVAKLDLSDASPSGTFYLACGLVGFSLTNPVFDAEGVKKVKEIRISLVDTESSEHVHLAGNAKIDVSNPSVPKVTYGLYNAHSITLRSASGLFEDNQMYYICLPELSNVPVNFSFILENDKFYNRKVYISSVRAVKDAFDGVLALSASDFTATQTTDISTVEQFIAWYSNPAAIYGTVNITKDIDFSSVQTDALKCHDFYGTFNGNGKTLKGLKIQPSTDDMVGLFANVNSATVSDVTIDNMQIVNESGTTVEYAGGIGAYVRSNAHIIGCNVINTTLSSTGYCGGIAGKADRSVIDGCTSKTNTLNSNKTGALVGEFGASCTVEASYSLGTQLSGSNTGAIVGYLFSTGNNIVSCFSDAICNGSSKTIVGGYTGNIWKNTNVVETYYIGNSNVTISHNLGSKITSQELKNKEDAMNSALETSGSNYRFTEGTDNEPLILTKK